jgi:carboxyl-terminal processing protease
MPDIFVPIDTSNYHVTINKILVDGNFNSYVYNYYLQHKQQIDQYKTATDYVQQFNNSNEMWEGLVPYALKDSVNLKVVTAKEKESLEQRLKAALARYRWRNAGFYQVLNSNDEAVIKAVETMNK